MAATLSGDTLKVANILNEAGSDIPGNLQNYTIKARLLYDASTSTILESYNIDSVTVRSTGAYTVNFTNDFSDTNYLIMGTIQMSATGYAGFGYDLVTPLKSVSQCNIGSVDASTSSFSRTDSRIINMIFIGN